MQDLARLCWALASAGCLSEGLLGAISPQSLGTGPLSSRTEQQLAAAYLAKPVIGKHFPQSVLVHCLQARKASLADKTGTKVSLAVAKMWCLRKKEDSIILA